MELVGLPESKPRVRRLRSLHLDGLPGESSTPAVAPMPERLDRVRIATRYGECEIRWTCRAEWLAKIRQLESEHGDEVIRAFQAVGASRPVELDHDGKALVVEAIHSLERDADGSMNLSTDVRELLRALVDELDRDLIG
jgi:hypothetical protein